MTSGVQIVTCLQSPPNTQSRANAATSRDFHHMCLGSGHSPSLVGRADSMCLHGRPCVWLPFAAVCCYTLFYLLMMPAVRLVCQRPSSNLPYFRTPLANFLLSRPNKVEYGNSKTTTLMPWAKCTRPLFQGRTGFGGRPSGWHDIVTCWRLVVVLYSEFRLRVLDIGQHQRLDMSGCGRIIIVFVIVNEPQNSLQ